MYKKAKSYVYIWTHNDRIMNDDQMGTISIEKRYIWNNTNDQDEHNECKRWISWGAHNLGDLIYKQKCAERP